ncbi:MAG: NADH-dependent [FeFe] hydrogenase, group A6 [Spirochaetaceae bacterium]|nr:NADH-dependent [FeFe] hydrogenase, group A6 [Spirochaetaceae bacterium]MDT8298457.1 NADH-dependent [FeFe] hydrogenase, group A6 [Spirochaetaceae bacterium]
MPKVKIQINGKPVEVEAGTSILKAAKAAQVKIPTLCYHPDLEPWAACGICVVKVENSPKMVRACATSVVEGQNYITHDPELMEVRKTVVELMHSNHPNECLTCARNGTCELQNISEDFCIRNETYCEELKDLPADHSTTSIVLDPRKCINCGRCALVCQQLQDVWALEFINRGYDTVIQPAGGALLGESPCIKCGQCSAHCPVGAIYEKDETDDFLKAVRTEGKHVVVQVAPATRVAIGEAFGMEPGTIMTGQMYAALRMLGADAVFDTNFSADLTIMEEGSELVKRLTEKDHGPLPQITSCCPAWTDYMEKYYSDMIPHFSTAKSPMMMQGAITKTYYADKAGVDPKDIYSVAIMPCTAKKYEIGRDDNMAASGHPDMDLVLTTRELARLIKRAGINFLTLPEEGADSPIGAYSGAGTIFGVTGGVMEAALRTAHILVTGEELKDVNITAVRGMEGVKVGEVPVGDVTLKVAVAHGMVNVRQLMDEVREARIAGKEPPYHFIEVMACKGGCIGGGGQPYFTDEEVRQKRVAGIYSDDEKSTVRCSHQNPEITQIYKEFLGEPLSHKSHELLHTKYQARPLYQK